MEWLAFVLAPVAASIQVGIGYALVKPACAAGGNAILTTLSLLTLAMSVGGAWLGWTRMQLAIGASDSGGRALDRRWFVAALAAGFNVLVALLILTSTLPHFILSPCE
jgi:hypothetical protein